MMSPAVTACHSLLCRPRHGTKRRLIASLQCDGTGGALGRPRHGPKTEPSFENQPDVPTPARELTPMHKEPEIPYDCS
jgi:hypothetical protein